MQSVVQAGKASRSQFILLYFNAGGLKGIELVSFHSCSRLHVHNILGLHREPYVQIFKHVKMDLDCITGTIQMHYEKVLGMIGTYNNPARLDADNIVLFLEQPNTECRLETFNNLCVRTNWDDEAANWLTFNALPESKKRKVAKYV